jgi:hypothetical protein
MPKTVEYHKHGIREISEKKGCHSCWDCVHCRETFDPTFYICNVGEKCLSSHTNRKFPFDNTKCKEFDSRHEK